MPDDAYDELFAESARRARERAERRRRRRSGWRGLIARLFDGRLHELRHLLDAPGGRLLAGAVGAIALATLAGLVVLWPGAVDHGAAAPVTPSVTAHVTSVSDMRCASPTPQQCRALRIRVRGRDVKMSLGPVTSAPAVDAGETIRVAPVTMPAGERLPAGAEPYTFIDVDRHGALLWMGVLVALAATLLLRRRGLLAVLGVALSLVVVLEFLVPAILDGRPGLLVALVSALAVMFITLVLTNGIGVQTLAAALGITTTLLLSCGLAAAGLAMAHLDGKTDDVALALGVRDARLSLQGVVLAGMLIGALGVLADTAVTQASAVMALRRANPGLRAPTLYREGFVVGRDHLSATIHTLVLAYTGAALPLLLVMRQSRLGITDALNAQTIAEPIVATVVGCAALIAAVPLTTGLAAAFAVRIPAGSLPEGHGHGHAH
ncbi:MAG TPA: YibE/F family protein [Baekduia sp.]|nr:YibE/F family protein [Baekduia sp.]